MSKKILSMCLALLMVIGLLPLSVFAEGPDYFCITNISDEDATVTWKRTGNPAAISLSYSYNGTDWTPVTTLTASGLTADIPLLAKSSVYFKNTTGALNGSYTNYDKKAYSVKCDKPHTVSGDITTLLSENGGVASVPDYAFRSLFVDAASGSSDTNLVSAENLRLPSATLGTYCYNSMFNGCTSLVSAPAISATTMAAYSCAQMFAGCSALKQAPALNATVLADNCYASMFDECSALEQAPALNATVLANYCYSGMFHKCSALETAPALPAATLAKKCYYEMFSGCKALKTAPVISAEVLAESCCESMFYGCKALKIAPALNAKTLAESCYSEMFSGCSSLAAGPAKLPAPVLSDYCYNSMFNACTSLVSAPAISATTMAAYSCAQMFAGCSSLKQAPELPAKKLASSCYASMFNGCTSLTEGPQLPAAELASSCYSAMFANCSALTIAPQLPAAELKYRSYYGMFAFDTSLTTAQKIDATTLAEDSLNMMFSGCTALERISFAAGSFSDAAVKYAGNWVADVADSGTFISGIDLLGATFGADAVPKDGTHKWNMTTPIAVTAPDNCTLLYKSKTDDAKENDQHTVLGVSAASGTKQYLFGASETITLIPAEAPENKHFANISYICEGDSKPIVVSASADGTCSFTPGKNCTVSVNYASDHDHEFSAFIASGNAITATCANGDGNCSLGDCKLSLTLTVDPGSSIGVSLTGADEWEQAGLSLPAIEHTKKGEENYTSAPISESGDYTARISFTPQGSSNVYTATQDFSIELHSVTVLCGSADKSGSILPGTEVSITAPATVERGEQTKAFSEWTTEDISLVSTVRETTFIMPNRDVEITANYVDCYPFVIKCGDSIISSPEIPRSFLSASAAAAPEGMVFRRWDAEGITLSEPESNTPVLSSVIMPESKLVLTAVYDTLYTITAVRAAASSSAAFSGTSVTVTADAPLPDMYFKEWIASGAVLTDDQKKSNPMSFDMPKSNVTLEASYAYYPSVTVTNGTAKIPSGTASALIYAPSGSAVTITAGSAPSGKQFLKWESDPKLNLLNASDPTTSFIMPNENVSIAALYEDLYTVTVINGTADKTSVFKATAITITADPAPSGKRFKEWTSDEGVSFANASATQTAFTMPSKNVTVTAVYEDLYSVIVTSGTAVPDIAGAGDTVTVTRSAPAFKHKFKEWRSSDGVSFADPAAASTTFIMPANNVTVEAFYVREVDMPRAKEGARSFIYDGSEKTFWLVNADDIEYYTLSCDNSDATVISSYAIASGCGMYILTASLKDKETSQWFDGTTEDLTFTFMIEKRSVEIPAEDTTDFTYDGWTKNYVFGNTGDNSYYTLSCNDANVTLTNNLKASAVKAGSYTITAALNDTDETQWSDGTTEAKTYTFNLNKRRTPKPVADPRSFTYNGEEQIYRAAYVKDGSYYDYSGIFYTISGNVHKEKGVYKVTVLPKENFCWDDGTDTELTFNFEIGNYLHGYVYYLKEASTGNITNYVDLTCKLTERASVSEVTDCEPFLSKFYTPYIKNVPNGTKAVYYLYNSKTDTSVEWSKVRLNELDANSTDYYVYAVLSCEGYEGQTTDKVRLITSDRFGRAVGYKSTLVEKGGIEMEIHFGELETEEKGISMFIPYPWPKEVPDRYEMLNQRASEFSRAEDLIKQMISDLSNDCETAVFLNYLDGKYYQFKRDKLNSLKALIPVKTVKSLAANRAAAMMLLSAKPGDMSLDESFINDYLNCISFTGTTLLPDEDFNVPLADHKPADDSKLFADFIALGTELGDDAKMTLKVCTLLYDPSGSTISFEKIVETDPADYGNFVYLNWGKGTSNGSYDLTDAIPDEAAAMLDGYTLNGIYGRGCSEEKLARDPAPEMCDLSFGEDLYAWDMENDTVCLRYLVDKDYAGGKDDQMTKLEDMVYIIYQKDGSEDWKTTADAVLYAKNGSTAVIDLPAVRENAYYGNVQSDNNDFFTIDESALSNGKLTVKAVKDFDEETESGTLSFTVDVMFKDNEQEEKLLYSITVSVKPDFVPPEPEYIPVSRKVVPPVRKNLFADVNEDCYFYDAVYWAVDRGITKGTSEDTFSPYKLCTRAEDITFLYRAVNGVGGHNAKTLNFWDVPEGSYYEDALLWAVGNGVTSGTWEGYFSPDLETSREVFVTMLYRTACLTDPNAKKTGEAALAKAQRDESIRFGDLEEGSYYEEAVYWAKEAGVVNGVGDTMIGDTWVYNAFGLGRIIDRAQIVTMLCRYFGK